MPKHPLSIRWDKRLEEAAHAIEVQARFRNRDRDCGHVIAGNEIALALEDALSLETLRALRTALGAVIICRELEAMHGKQAIRGGAA